jgi:hypothetical protein
MLRFCIKKPSPQMIKPGTALQRKSWSQHDPGSKNIAAELIYSVVTRLGAIMTIPIEWGRAPSKILPYKNITAIPTMCPNT